MLSGSAAPEMPEIGIERFGARDRQKDGAQHDEADAAAMGEEQRRLIAD